MKFHLKKNDLNVCATQKYLYSSGGRWQYKQLKQLAKKSKSFYLKTYATFINLLHL